MEHVKAIHEVLVVSGLKEMSLLPLASLYLLKQWQERNDSRLLHEHRVALKGSDILPGEPVLHLEDAASKHMDTVKRGYEICRFAMAPYANLGAVLYNLTHAPTSNVVPSPLPSPLESVLASPFLSPEEASLASIANVTPADVLYLSPSADATVSLPRHCILRRLHERELVLSIRGTISLSDVITDAKAMEIPFAFGTSAHEGIAHAAVNVYNSVKEVLLEELRRHAGFKLVITGHSLGAGTAILFTTHLYEERATCIAAGGTGFDFEDVDIECIAIAPPPVLRHVDRLPEGLSSLLTCWINRDDIVPRLSIDAVKDLLTLCTEIDDLHPAWMRMVTSIDVHPLLQAHPSWLAHLSRRPTPRDALPEGRPQLQIPGTVYMMQARVDDLPRNLVEATLKDVKSALASTYADATTAMAGHAEAFRMHVAEPFLSFLETLSPKLPPIADPVISDGLPSPLPASPVEGAGALPPSPGLVPSPSPPLPSSRVLVARVQATSLCHLTVSDTCVTDHLPDAYMAVFANILGLT